MKGIFVLVAKSYQSLEQLSEVFAEAGKKYVMVRLKSGKEKKVRWYTEKEYSRLYPDHKISSSESRKFGPQKKVLGFIEDKIYLVSAPIPDYDCRYSTRWGWYIPTPLTNPPFGAKELFWSEVGDNSGYVRKSVQLI